MSKVLLILLLLFILLAVACRGRNAAWQPSSPTPPQFEAQPHLLLRSKSEFSQFTSVDIATGQMEETLLQQAPSLTPLLADEYHLLDDILIGQAGRYISLPNGLASPNGLWLTASDDAGLRLFRIDGQEMLLSENGRFPTWSSDSQWLAYADDAGLWAVEMSSLTPQQIGSTAAEPLAWSHDNQQLLLRSENSAIVFDIATKSERALRGVDASQIHDQPVWSLDGSSIYARYGNNGNTDAVPQTIQARLVAIDLTNNQSTLRDLLPNVRNQGITTFLPSPDRSLIAVRHHVCRNEFGGLFPIIPTRTCEDSYLLVDGKTGQYETLPALPPEIVLAWKRPFPAVALADLPMPSSTTSSEVSSLPNSTTYWQPDAQLGHNPATAVPLGQALLNVERGRLLSVVDVVFGEEALALALNANGTPPYPGYTYIGVRQRIATESGRASIFVTPRTRLVDTQLVAHQEILWLNAEGQPITELAYSAEEPAEYWQLFTVAEDAIPWLLFASAGVADNLPDLYFRLDDNAEWGQPAGADPLPANTAGVTEPAGVGETAVSSHWQLTLLDSEANSLDEVTDKPIKVRIVYTGAAPSASRLFTCLSYQNFSGIAPTQLGQRGSYPSQPFQSLYHEPCLLPGGVYEGWITAVSNPDTDAITFRFTPPNRSGDPFGDRTFEKNLE